MSTSIETIHAISRTTAELTTRYGKWQAFREACRLHGAKVPTETAPVAVGTPARTAGSGAGKAQAPSAAPAAGTPLGRAVERLIAAGQASTEAPATEDSPLAKACKRLGAK
jgi:hypothetical protein